MKVEGAQTAVFIDACKHNIGIGLQLGDLLPLAHAPPPCRYAGNCWFLQSSLLMHVVQNGGFGAV